MNQRKTQSLLHRLHKHARDNCASHTGKDGCLETTHGKCVYAFKADSPTANVCPYFMRSVAPADRALFNEYLDQFPDDYPLKPPKETAAGERATCASSDCNNEFTRKSNRHKYCEACAAENRRQKERQRKQEKRAGYG